MNKKTKSYRSVHGMLVGIKAPKAFIKKVDEAIKKKNEKLASQKLKIKVMPDFTSSGVWDYKTGVMIDERSEKLNLSRGLQIRLNRWINFSFEKCFTKHYNYKKDKRIWNKMNIEGFQIACDIKEKCPHLDVYFMHETTEGLVETRICKVSYFHRRK